MSNKKLPEEKDISLSYLILQISLFLFVAFIYLAIFLMAYEMGYETEENPGIILYPPVFLAIKQYVVLIFNLYILFWFLKKIPPRKIPLLKTFFLILYTLLFFILLPTFIFGNPFSMWWPSIIFMPLFLSACIVSIALKAYLEQKDSKD